MCVPARLERRADKSEGRRPRSHGRYQSEAEEKINWVVAKRICARMLR
jgi:hypothetical protein